MPQDTHAAMMPLVVDSFLFNTRHAQQQTHSIVRPIAFSKTNWPMILFTAELLRLSILPAISTNTVQINSYTFDRPKLLQSRSIGNLVYNFITYLLFLQVRFLFGWCTNHQYKPPRCFAPCRLDVDDTLGGRRG